MDAERRKTLKHVPSKSGIAWENGKMAKLTGFAHNFLSVYLLRKIA
jgi:hypothetical protein